MSARRKSVRPVRARLGTFMQMRAWAMATALFLIGWYLGGLLVDRQPGDIVVMLVTAIGGFEFALYAHDLWQRRGTRHG